MYPILSREDSSVFQYGCDVGAHPKPIDPFGYHLVGCKVGANAIRLHNEVVSLLARLFRSLRVDAIVEPIRLQRHQETQAIRDPTFCVGIQGALEDK